MDEQPEVGTIFFHVALLAIIVLLVDERLIRGALAVIPAMLLAQRAIGATQAKSIDSVGSWTGIHDRRMNEHVRKHVDRLLGHFREFYAMNHLMTSGGMSSEEALTRASDLEKDLNRLLDEVTAGPQETESGTLKAAPAATPATPVSSESTAT